MVVLATAIVVGSPSPGDYGYGGAPPPGDAAEGVGATRVGVLLRRVGDHHRRRSLY